MAVFKCPVPSCEYIASSLSQGASHQRVHIQLKNFKFKCQGALCTSRVFASYSGLQNHIKDSHPEDKSSSIHSSLAHKCQVSTDCAVESSNVQELCRHLQSHLQENVVAKCPLCSQRSKYSTFEKLLSHFTADHALVNVIDIKCSVASCQEPLTSFDNLRDHYYSHLSKNVSFRCPLHKYCGSDSLFSEIQNFRTHLSVKHPDWNKSSTRIEIEDFPQNPSTSGGANAEGRSFNIGNEFERMDTDMDTSNQDDDEDEDPITTDMFFKYIGHFYSKLLAEHILPDTTVDSISKSLKLMSEFVQHQFSVAMSRELEARGMKKEDITDVTNAVMACDVFYAAHHSQSPGPTFTSTYLREKFMKNSQVFVEPEEISLDKDKEGGAIAHFVDPSKVLSLLLKDSSVQELVLKSFQRQPNPELIQDYTDGSGCRMKCTCERIDIIAFQDAFNAGNPLGSAKNKYKFNGTYWTLGNLPSSHRSKVDAINLAYLINNKFLSNTKRYGPAKCFKPVIEALRKLETDGVEFMGRRIPVCIQYYVGDSLGAHEIGGFIGKFSGEFFCRFCHITRKTFLSQPWILRRPFRTAETYNDALRSLQDVQSRNPKVVTFRGVKHDSILNSIEGFHVCDPRLPPCLAHDVFEGGVVDHDFAEIISKLVEKEWFSYPELNDLIKGFICVGPDGGNKPAFVNSKGKKLGGHAVQNWTLLRIFPFIIEGYIKDPSDEIWQLYLKLKKLVEYASSPSFTYQDLRKLKELSINYMKERRRLLSSLERPKHHFLMEYADLIPIVGPIIHLFTLRFEQKHQIFKKIFKTCRNSINPGFTMARRHQIWMAHLTSGSVFDKGLLIRKSLHYLPQTYNEKTQQILRNCFSGTEPTACEKIVLDGLKYRKDMHLILDGSSSDCINVGKIELILNHHERVFFILQKFESRLWEEYGVFKLHDTSSDTVCLAFSDLKFPVELSVYEFQESKCFSLKHFI